MTADKNEEYPGALVSIESKRLLGVLIVGAIAGVITWGLTFVLGSYILKNAFCPANAVTSCSASLSYATAIAAVVGAGVGLFGLMRLQIFRALLVVIAATVSLWGVTVLLGSTVGLQALIPTMLLYALAYGFFAWLVRVRVFLVALLLIIVMVVATRLILAS